LVFKERRKACLDHCRTTLLTWKSTEELGTQVSGRACLDVPAATAFRRRVAGGDDELFEGVLSGETLMLVLGAVAT
jgi:hypothetical protein